MFHNSKLQRKTGSVIPLGFILVVTIIALALIMFNSTTVPALSKDAEIEAHKDVETDFIKMDSSIYRTATTEVPQPIVLGNRVEYPPALAPIKTPSPKFESLGPHNISTRNAIYTSNSSKFNKTRSTNSLIYTREYNYYSEARDFGYEHGLFYTQPKNATHGNTNILVRDEQSIISNDSITVVSVSADITFSRPSPTQLSITSNKDKNIKTEITNAPGEHIELVVPTRIPKTEWDSLLEQEKISNGGHVTNVTYRTTNPYTGADDGVNYVVIELEQGIKYEFNLFSVLMEKY